MWLLSITYQTFESQAWDNDLAKPSALLQPERIRAKMTGYRLGEGHWDKAVSKMTTPLRRASVPVRVDARCNRAYSAFAGT
jgi:hypothetical protein